MTLSTDVQVSQYLDLVFSSDFCLLSDLATPTHSITRTETLASLGQSPEITNFHIGFSAHTASSQLGFIRTPLCSRCPLDVLVSFPTYPAKFHTPSFQKLFCQTFHYLPLFIAPIWFYAAERCMAKITLQVMWHLYKTGTTIKSHIKTQLSLKTAQHSIISLLNLSLPCQ